MSWVGYETNTTATREQELIWQGQRIAEQGARVKDPDLFSRKFYRDIKNLLLSQGCTEREAETNLWKVWETERDRQNAKADLQKDGQS